jgi:hypothetical protein
VKESSVEVRIFKLARLPRDTIAVAKLLLASEIIKSRPKLSNIGYSDDGVSLRDLNSLVDVAFSWSERLQITTSNELRNIETNYMRNREGLWRVSGLGTLISCAPASLEAHASPKAGSRNAQSASATY